MEKGQKAHVLVLPFPAQGHINPMLEFSKRLVYKGVKATLVITKFISKSMSHHAESDTVGVEMISDGYDDGGCADAEAYLTSFETVGSQSLSELVKKLESCGYPVSCIVYDAFFTWALEVAKGCGIFGAPFFTQSCAVNNVYYHLNDKYTETPTTDSLVTIPGLPPLKPPDLPSFFYVVGSYPVYLKMFLNQYINLEKADWIFVNTFQELEVEVVEWMAKQFPIRTIGPTMPSMYLDKRIKDDTDYGLNLYKPDSSICMSWLYNKAVGSVVYVSFGSMAALGIEQMEELACGLKQSDYHFLWVVRASEEDKLPIKFKEDASEKGLIVRWSPQLDVLAHQALGCFVTHCGWNSVLEALSLGVPMVGIPQWTDQTTNSKFVHDIWGVGIRASADEKGIVKREEVEHCIRQVMEGEKTAEIKKNAIKWRKLAKEAMDEGGSSDKNFDEFVSKLI